MGDSATHWWATYSLRKAESLPLTLYDTRVQLNPLTFFLCQLANFLVFNWLLFDEVRVDTFDWAPGCTPFRNVASLLLLLILFFSLLALKGREFEEFLIEIWRSLPGLFCVKKLLENLFILLHFFDRSMKIRCSLAKCTLIKESVVWMFLHQIREFLSYLT